MATIDPAAHASRGELTIDVQAPLCDPGGDLLSLVPASDPARTDVSWSETTVVKGEGSSEISNGIKRGAPLSSLIRAVSQAIGRVLRIGENSSNTNSEDEAIDSSSNTLIVPQLSVNLLVDNVEEFFNEKDLVIDSKETIVFVDENIQSEYGYRFDLGADLHEAGFKLEVGGDVIGLIDILPEPTHGLLGNEDFLSNAVLKGLDASLVKIEGLNHLSFVELIEGNRLSSDPKGRLKDYLVR